MESRASVSLSVRLPSPRGLQVSVLCPPNARSRGMYDIKNEDGYMTDTEGIWICRTALHSIALTNLEAHIPRYVKRSGVGRELEWAKVKEKTKNPCGLFEEKGNVGRTQQRREDGVQVQLAANEWA